MSIKLNVVPIDASKLSPPPLPRPQQSPIPGPISGG